LRVLVEGRGQAKNDQSRTPDRDEKIDETRLEGPHPTLEHDLHHLEDPCTAGCVTLED